MDNNTTEQQKQRRRRPPKRQDDMTASVRWSHTSTLKGPMRAAVQVGSNLPLVKPQVLLPSGSPCINDELLKEESTPVQGLKNTMPDSHGRPEGRRARNAVADRVHVLGGSLRQSEDLEGSQQGQPQHDPGPSPPAYGSQKGDCIGVDSGQAEQPDAAGESTGYKGGQHGSRGRHVHGETACERYYGSERAVQISQKLPEFLEFLKGRMVMVGRGYFGHIHEYYVHILYQDDRT
ncbi:hypothetical protein ACJ73_01657 [Blastomyces percursus]|uniref:Uncharacterized protein n=1 Tax=Blastomyces percursus TaxID=1658174 RepID=A0A1J9R3J2_9EURO|nr:hypothetical protein ACJ73_01657 [Blastomyces percursus]